MQQQMPMNSFGSFPANFGDGQPQYKEQKSGFFGNMFGSLMGSKKAEDIPQMPRVERRASLNEVDSDDLDGELNLSDDEDGVQKRASFKRQRREKKKDKKANKY